MLLALRRSGESDRADMSEAAAIATFSPAPASPHAGERRQRDIDLYAEGNSFAESDGSGQTLADLFGKDGFSFRDALDIINPLHHLPVVGTLYRALTGDELAPGSRILGGTLFGGIGGFVTALANAIVENETGSDIGDKVLAFFQDDAPPHQNLAAAGGMSAEAEPVAAAAVAPPAPSPPAPRAIPIFAGPPRTLAKTPLDIGAGGKPTAGEDDPTEALIRARAAVPASRRSGIPGLPHERAMAQQTPAAGGAVTLVAAAAPQQTPAPISAAADTATPSAPPADVGILMRDALDKYQALMKRRAGPSISSDH
jgi:hypothetical protein